MLIEIVKQIIRLFSGKPFEKMLLQNKNQGKFKCMLISLSRNQISQNLISISPEEKPQLACDFSLTKGNSDLGQAPRLQANKVGL